ncbi:hypothetical protein DEFR109230_11250 [Deinococcus frigens]
MTQTQALTRLAGEVGGVGLCGPQQGVVMRVTGEVGGRIVQRPEAQYHRWSGQPGQGRQRRHDLAAVRQRIGASGAVLYAPHRFLSSAGHGAAPQLAES